jgi:predicted SprT family Zn-dependent metalloprotease
MDLKELQEIAARELEKHGLAGWTFHLGATRRRLGVCKYRQKRIEIAEYYAQNSAATTVLDTLLHEIAHALAGPKAHHGPAWKAVAMRLGARPEACETSDQAVMKPGDWQATCSECKQTFHLYRRPRSLSGYRCRCPARTPLMFDFVGDPAQRPFVPMSAEKSANWEARCTGCGTLHLRLRRPKPVTYVCRCQQRCKLAWKFRPSSSAQD